MKLLCMPLLLLLQNSPVTQLAISKFLVLHLSLENAICPAFSKNLCSHFRSFSIVITLHKPGTLSQYKKTSDISLSIIYQLAVKIHSQFYLSFTLLYYTSVLLPQPLSPIKQTHLLFYILFLHPPREHIPRGLPLRLSTASINYVQHLSRRNQSNPGFYTDR